MVSSNKKEDTGLSRQKSGSFLGGTFVLMLSGIVVKVIGAFFSIPLANLYGADGNDIFISAYYVYSAMYVISSAGLPVAVSKMVSEARALGRSREVARIARVALWTFLLLGGVLSLAMVLLVAYVGYFVHAVVVYSSTVKVLAGVSPLTFFKGMAPAIMFAFSSASSVGTLPFTLECSERLGARREVASFVLPLGATINMDGTAIYQGVCAIFIASCFGIELTLAQMATIVVTATLASIGTAGVPGAGMVMLAMVLTSVGLPVEGIALVAGVDRIFDMGRTVLNITGDASCAVVVSNLERKKN